MKKVLIFSTSYFPIVGGAEVAVKEITDRIEDVEFDLITLRLSGEMPKTEKVGNVNVYRIGFVLKKVTVENFNKYPWKINKLLFPFLAVIKAIRLNKKNNYGALWAIMANYAGFAAMFYKYLSPKKKLILTIQEGHPVPEYKKMFGPAFFLLKKLFKKADYVQAISNYLADFSREMGFKGVLDVIPNAVDIKHFSNKYSADEIASIRERYAAGNGKIIITTSRLVEKNGIDDLIKSLNFLNTEVKLLILGTGPDLMKLKGIVSEHGLVNRVFFPGHIAHDQLPKYLQAADVFIRPSLSEGLGNSFLEAMAAELPVIATPVGGIPDFLTHRVTGFFCEPRDPASIAREVNIVLKDFDLREVVIQNAKRMVEEKYDWNKIAGNMKKIFINLVK